MTELWGIRGYDHINIIAVRRAMNLSADSHVEMVL